jgi:hypothetical protein
MIGQNRRLGNLVFVKYGRLFVKCDRVNNKWPPRRMESRESEPSLPSRSAWLKHLIH